MSKFKKKIWRKLDEKGNKVFINYSLIKQILIDRSQKIRFDLQL